MSDASDPTTSTPFAPGTTSPPSGEAPAPAPNESPAAIRAATAPDVDLDAIERDLTAVEVALGRLADGTYWTDEITGQPLPDSVLELDPTARRA